MVCLNEAPLGVCSGHGKCILDGDPSLIAPDSMHGHDRASCYCDSGWIGDADFVNHSGQDCQTHELTVRIFYGVSMLIAFAAVVISVVRWVQGIQRIRSNVSAQSKPLSDRFRLFWRELGNRMAVNTAVGTSLMTTASVLHVGWMHLIGTQLDVTVIVILQHGLVWLGIHDLVYSFLKLEVSLLNLTRVDRNELDRHLKRMETVLFLSQIIFNTSATVGYIVMYAAPRYQAEGTALFYVSECALILTAVLAFGQTVRMVLPILRHTSAVIGSRVAAAAASSAVKPLPAANAGPSDAVQIDMTKTIGSVPESPVAAGGTAPPPKSSATVNRAGGGGGGGGGSDPAAFADKLEALAKSSE